MQIVIDGTISTGMQFFAVARFSFSDGEILVVLLVAVAFREAAPADDVECVLLLVDYIFWLGHDWHPILRCVSRGFA